METLDDFLSTVHYQSMDPADETTYFLLNDRLKELSPQYENNGNYLFYLATPPLLYELIPKCLHDAGLLKKPGLKRIIVEKPFGAVTDNRGLTAKETKQLQKILNNYTNGTK